MNWNKILVAVLSFLTILRIRAATQIGQTVDEAHYVLYGINLDWSYFDHPPLIGWVHALFQKLPFHELVNARLPSILIALFTSWLVFYYLKSKKYSEKNISIAVIGLNLTPMFNTVSIALLPDTLLMPLTILTVIQTEKVLEKSTYSSWLKLGVILGLSALAKYTAVVFIPALVFIFVYKNKIKEILSPKLWVGVITSILFIAPILYWNIQNDFISFKYQGDHISKMDGSIFKNISQSVAVQAISWGIGPFLLSLFFVLFWLKNIKNLEDKFVNFVFSFCLLCFFCWVSVTEVLLPHWMLIFFVITIPMATVELLQTFKKQNIMYIAFLPSVLISAALLFETAFKIFPTEKTAPLYEGIYGWDTLVNRAIEHMNVQKSADVSLAVMNWTLGSRVIYYARKRAEVFVLDHRFDQFDIWNKSDPIGRDFIVLIEKNKVSEQLEKLNCRKLNQIGENISKLENITVNHFVYYYCNHLIDIKR